MTGDAWYYKAGRGLRRKLERHWTEELI